MMKTWTVHLRSYAQYPNDPTLQYLDFQPV